MTTIPEVGAKLASVTKTMRFEDMVDFSNHHRGGMNSIHTSRETAKQRGMEGAVAQGLMSYGLQLRVLVDAFGEQWFNGGRLHSTFVRPVYEGDTITAAGEIKSIDRSSDSVQTVTVELWCVNQNGSETAFAQAELPL